MTTNTIINEIVKSWNEQDESFQLHADNNGFNVDDLDLQAFKPVFIRESVFSYCGNEPRAKEIKAKLMEIL